MKTLLVIAFCVGSLLFSGCSPSAGSNHATKQKTREARQEVAPAPVVEKDSPIGMILRGEHELMSLKTLESTEGKLKDNVFVFIEKNVVKFMWKNNQGEYQLSSLPFEKIRLVIKDVTAPTVKFRWVGNPYNSHIPDNVMDRVKYAVLTVEKSYIKSDIKFEL